MPRSIISRLRQYDTLIKWVSVAVIVVFLIVVLRALPARQVIRAGTGWIHAWGFWAPLVYGLLLVIATVLFVPGWILAMGAGALFGLWTGFLTASLASTTGAMLAFAIARHLVREKVAQFAHGRPRFDAVDHAVGEGGWKIVALLRLSPVIPSNLQNYLYGMTRVRFWPCLLATWLATLPGIFLTVYIGHIAAAAIAGQWERKAWEWMIPVVGFLATGAVTAYITVLARRRLGEQTELEDFEDPGRT